jgi:hypothetical protein
MERLFVFTESKRSAQNSFRTSERPRKYAFRESEIKEIYTQVGSEQTYLMVNGIEVEGTFEGLIRQLGKKVEVGNWK